MGARTVSQIVAEGLAMAGASDSLLTRGKEWLRLWLQSQYDSWDWAFLYREVEGLSLPSGSQTITIGVGDQGIQEAIRKFNDPFFLYDASYSVRSKIHIREAHSSNLNFDETINNPATNRGVPQFVKVRPTPTWGKWSLVFNRHADRDYLVKGSYFFRPDDDGDDATPLYPNDRTMMRVVEAEALRWKKLGDEYHAALNILSSLSANDRLRYGISSGIHDTPFGLDPNVFR
jgi:hypothetical protein